MEEDFRQHKTHNFFRTIREREGKSNKPLSTAKDKSGNVHTIQEEVLNCCKKNNSRMT